MTINPFNVKKNYTLLGYAETICFTYGSYTELGGIVRTDGVSVDWSKATFTKEERDANYDED